MNAKSQFCIFAKYTQNDRTSNVNPGAQWTDTNEQCIRNCRRQNSHNFGLDGLYANIVMLSYGIVHNVMSYLVPVARAQASKATPMGNNKHQ